MAAMHPQIVAAAFAVAVIGFVVLSAFAATRNRFEGDLWATRQMQKLDSEPVERVIDVTEDIGDDPYILLIWIGAGAAFYLPGGWSASALFALAGAIRMLNPLLKDLIERPRPPPDLVEVSEFPGTFAFPSGHAASAITVFGLIFYFTHVYVKHAALRLAVQAACVWMIVVVGIERVYAGEHWPSDVIGGFWYGGMIVCGIVILHRFLQRRGMAR